MSIYVVSEDIQILLARWAREKGFALPDASVFFDLRESLQNTLEGIFGRRRVDMVSEGMLCEGMRTLIQDAELPAISIDKTYRPKDTISLEINRAVNDNLSDAEECARAGHQSISTQVAGLGRRGLREVVLVDDVIFTGHCIMRVIDHLSKHGIIVHRVIAGIVVGEGYRLLRRRGIDVRWVRFYDTVIDEICERDFYPGVPYSGRALVNGARDTGVPYLLPFGDPTRWASIPKENTLIFSRDCLRNANRLWREVEKASGKPVWCCDVPRLPLNAPDDTTSFVKYLEKV